MSDIKKQLENLEKKKDRLVEARKNEIMDIFIETKALAIDDRLLAGSLIFLADKTNEKDPIIARFKELGKIIKIPSRKKRNRENKEEQK